ncbi:MAG: GWxTD domain-containing protein [Gemmatimonadota bacterium]
MRTRPLIAFAVITLSAGIGFSALPDNWRDYFEGPPGYLITRKERKQWKKVDTPAQAEQFIDLFWAKRDPNLETPLNEFKEAFDLRVEAADTSFSNDRERGAMTDRGKVLILLGRPARRAERSSETPGLEEGSRHLIVGRVGVGAQLQHRSDDRRQPPAGKRSYAIVDRRGERLRVRVVAVGDDRQFAELAERAAHPDRAIRFEPFRDGRGRHTDRVRHGRSENGVA